ncbi:MAG: D-glycerate dehydrogenase [Nitrososphaeria archaeon]
MKPKILTTLELPSNALEKLKEYFIVEGGPDLIKDRVNLLNSLKDKVGLLTAPHIKVDKELFEHAPNLMVVSTYSVGYDHIDVPEATRRGIYVCYTPGVLSDCVAEVTWGLILSTYKRISEAERIVRARKWVKGIYKEPLGRDLKGKTLGIIGLGRIGRRVAEIGRCFGMNVIYYDIVKPSDADKLDFQYCDLETLLKNADVVSVHVPLQKETYHLIDESKLRLMKRDAIIVNTSRGAVIDEKALIKALKEGWIMGAGLDVFETEPLPLDSELLDMENVVLSPHRGSASIETRTAMLNLAINNLISVLKGEIPPALLNSDVVKVRPLSETKVI